MPNNNQLLPVICLMGPTASGKTDLAIALTQHFSLEIINVDSVQVYKGMDIGTCKPPLEIRNVIPHHLMDFLDPSVPYNAAQFSHDALCLIKTIHLRGNIPLLVGGTMLYFKVLQEGISNLPEANANIRATIEEKALQKGWDALYEDLAKVDPDMAAKINPSDTQRIQRALEVIAITGKPMSYWFLKPKNVASYRYINIGLLPLQTQRSVLHERIATRFDTMLNQGLVDEVEKLTSRQDLHWSLPSIRAVGYRQVWQYLQQELTFEQMRDKAIAATRQLSKRQLTWLRQWPLLKQFDFLEPELLNKIILYLQLVLKEKKIEYC